MFLRTLGFFQDALPQGVRKRPYGWDSSLPHFDINHRSSAFCSCLSYIEVMCKMSLGRKEGREGGREGRRWKERRKENQCVRELRYANV